MNREEIWKDVPEYEGLYQVSNLGNIKNNKNKIMKPFINNAGYCEIKLSKEKKKKHHRVHRLVAQTFLNNYDKDLQVNHKDGNKLNNNIENLEMLTDKENKRHAIENNLFKYANGKKRKVKQYDLNGNFIKEWDCMHDIEKTYKVSHTSIRFVCLRRNKTCKNYIWRYVDE